MSEPPASPDGEPVPDLPADPPLKTYKPHPDYIKIKSVVSWLRTAAILAVYSVVAMILFLAAPLKIALFVTLPLGLILVPLFLWLAIKWPSLFEKHHAYLVHQEGLELHMGILWRRVVFIPHSRLQHADVVQGMLERHHELANLVIFTAGSRHAKTVLKGLAHEDALELSKQLTFTHADAELPPLAGDTAEASASEDTQAEPLPGPSPDPFPLPDGTNKTELAYEP